MPSHTQDATRTNDIRMRAVRPLLTPALLQEWLPAPDAEYACEATAAFCLEGITSAMNKYNSAAPTDL